MISFFARVCDMASTPGLNNPGTVERQLKDAGYSCTSIQADKGMIIVKNESNESFVIGCHCVNQRIIQDAIERVTVEQYRTGCLSSIFIVAHGKTAALVHDMLRPGGVVEQMRLPVLTDVQAHCFNTERGVANTERMHKKGGFSITHHLIRGNVLSAKPGQLTGKVVFHEARSGLICRLLETLIGCLHRVITRVHHTFMMYSMHDIRNFFRD